MLPNAYLRYTRVKIVLSAELTPQQFKHIHLVLFRFQPFASAPVILRVNLKPGIFQPGPMARNQTRRAADVRIKDPVAFLRVPGKDPTIQLHRLLCRVESFLAGRSLRRALKQLRVVVKARPGVFAHSHTEILSNAQLSPDQKASCRRQREIVPAPDDLIFTHPEQLPEIILSRGCIPTNDFSSVFRRPGTAPPLYVGDVLRLLRLRAAYIG